MSSWSLLLRYLRESNRQVAVCRMRVRELEQQVATLEAAAKGHDEYRAMISREVHALQWDICRVTMWQRVRLWWGERKAC